MSSSEDRARRAVRRQAEALAHCPYEIVKVGGATALQDWERLRMQGRGAPIVIGDDKRLGRVLEQFHPEYFKRIDEEPGVAEILQKADQLTHPESLQAHRDTERSKFQELIRSDPELRNRHRDLVEQLDRADISVDDAPEIGEWPTQAPPAPGLSVARDWRTGEPIDAAYIMLIPTADWTTIPAYLKWGGWNECPLPEYHVAAFRSWRDRYGAELIALSDDVVNIRVSVQPLTRGEALKLAGEQYTYCNDIVDQGTGNLSNLAASLMADKWWFFWWD